MNRLSAPLNSLNNLADSLRSDMSRFENYTNTSGNYDATRQPAGIEIILGALSHGSKPLAEQIVLDAGCGTGNYAAALADKVSQVEGVEFNPGMLAMAQTKLSDRSSVRLREGSILDLPLDDDSCDGVMVNFVLHHLDDHAEADFAATRSAMAECQRVLAPGGTLVIQTCSAKQYQDGYWYSSLIPQAVHRALDRYIPLDDLEDCLRDVGLDIGERVALVEEVLQGDSYLDPKGPTRQEWRDGDSSWALVDDEEQANALKEIESMLADDSMDQFLAGREEKRREHGQATFVIGRNVPMPLQ